MESVSSGTKRKAASVATTLTSCPASLRRRITPGALYAAMPPVIPASTLATPVVYRAGDHGTPSVIPSLLERDRVRALGARAGGPRAPARHSRESGNPLRLLGYVC